MRGINSKNNAPVSVGRRVSIARQDHADSPDLHVHNSARALSSDEEVALNQRPAGYIKDVNRSIIPGALLSRRAERTGS